MKRLLILLAAILIFGGSVQAQNTNGILVVTNSTCVVLLASFVQNSLLATSSNGIPFFSPMSDVISNNNIALNSITNGFILYVGVPLVTTNPITALNTSYTNQTRGVIQVSITLNSLLAAQASCWMFQYPTNTTGLVRTNNIDFAQGPSIASTTIQTLQGTVYQGYIVKVVDKSSGLGSATLNTESGTGMTVNRITY